METLFDLQSGTGRSSTLLLEFGQGYLTFACYQPESLTFRRLHYSTFTEEETAASLDGILSGLQEEGFERVVVCTGYPRALLVPQQFFQKDYTLLQTVYENEREQPFSDTVGEWQIVNMYSLPDDLHRLITARFQNVRFYHAYTPALKIYNGFVSPDQVALHFTTHHFRTVVKKDSQLQLVQTYGYKTPLDVAYILLKICYEFSLRQEDVQLVVSGLVEEHSALFKELNQYFLNVHFAQAPIYNLPEMHHPQHYFTSLYNLAACVS